MATQKISRFRRSGRRDAIERSREREHNRPNLHTALCLVCGKTSFYERALAQGVLNNIRARGEHVRASDGQELEVYYSRRCRAFHLGHAVPLAPLT